MYNSHLTLDDRRVILKGIENGSTKAAIASTIGKEKSTVGKEIKLHRSLAYKCAMPLECDNYKKCAFGRKCTKDCPDYVPSNVQEEIVLQALVTDVLIGLIVVLTNINTSPN